MPCLALPSSLSSRPPPHCYCLYERSQNPGVVLFNKGRKKNEERNIGDHFFLSISFCSFVDEETATQLLNRIARLCIGSDIAVSEIFLMSRFA